MTTATSSRNSTAALLRAPVAVVRRLGLKGIVAVMAGGLVAWMLPWCTYLAVSLPETALAHNWSLTWVGFDVLLAVVAAATVWLVRRDDPRSALTAVAGSALLVMDGWFDVCTSSGANRALALGLALGLNLPLAVGAAWYGVRALGARVDRRGNPHGGRPRR